MPKPPSEWTLAELAAETALLLSRRPILQPSGRVAAVPSQRSIRFYAGLGLLDPPLRLHGRRAIYGVRHLRQLVAVKQLQARGYGLQEIKQTLATLEEGSLRRLAGIQVQESPVPEPQTGDWKEEVIGLRLDRDTLLLLEGPQRQLANDDTEAIRVAATPLLRLLRARRLLS